MLYAVIPISPQQTSVNLLHNPKKKKKLTKLTKTLDPIARI